ncbi:MAG: ATPase, T2SS/T4P/T4SS family [Planctomycetota bacterium]|jgi:type IV pilus assembly protein PilB
METLDPGAVEVPRDVLDMVPPDMARRYRIVPVGFERETGTLVVAMADPTDLRALDDLRFMLGCEVRPVGANGSSVDAAIDKHYSILHGDIDRFAADCEAYRPFSLKAILDRTRCAYHVLAARVCDLLSPRAPGQPLEAHWLWALVRAEPSVKLTDLLLVAAIEEDSSGIVLDLSESGGRASFQGEKKLREVCSFSAKVARRVTRRIRRMAGMPSTPRRGAEEGSIHLVVRDEAVDCHVNHQSGEHGERIDLKLVTRRNRESPARGAEPDA